MQTLIVAALCLGFVLGARRDLLLVSFDRAHAHALGLPVKFLDLAFLIVLSLVIVVALRPWASSWWWRCSLAPAPSASC